MPVVSNLDYVVGQTVPNLVSVPVAADGTVCLYASQATHLIADVFGWNPSKRSTHLRVARRVAQVEVLVHHRHHDREPRQ